MTESSNTDPGKSPGKTEAGKLTEKASELAAQAVAAAGPLKEKATELASTAAAAAGPLATQAKDKAAELAERGREIGVKGVGALAESIDKVTGGKYSDKISSVTSKIEEKLDPDKPLASKIEQRLDPDKPGPT